MQLRIPDTGTYGVYLCINKYYVFIDMYNFGLPAIMYRVIVGIFRRNIPRKNTYPCR